MRQVLSWRFLAALAALAGLVVGVVVLGGRGEGFGDEVAASVQPRRADLISNVASIQRDGFELTPFGTVSGTLIFDLPVGGDRIVRVQVFPGTPGVIECDDLDAPFRCVVIAELLGDSVVAFKLVPVGLGLTVKLPPIVELEGGFARLTDGWEVPYASTIDRACDPDVGSFSEFRAKHGSDYETVLDLTVGEIVAVTCSAA